MKVELQPGEELTVTFAETDGEITVGMTGEPGDYEKGLTQHRVFEPVDGGSFHTGRQLVTGIYVHADMPDGLRRVGVIYNETYNLPTVPRAVP